MKSKILVWAVVCSLLACSVNLTAKERRGAELVITKTDGQRVKGELIAVKQSSLLLLDSQSGADISVAVEDTSTITIVKKSKVGRGIMAGLLVSLAGGVAAAVNDKTNNGVTAPYVEVISVYTILFAVPATIIGAGIGLVSGIDQTMRLDKNSPDGIKYALNKLSRKARVPDVQ